MKEITVISGKGGTGKTSVSAALATAGRNLVLCDGDVDAPDLHLVLDPALKETHVFEGAWLASIDPGACTDCGLCMEYCRFDAIQKSGPEIPVIDPFRCEGCRLCERICPSGAIHSARSTHNHWFVSETRHGTFVHAHMGPGEENSGKLVTRVRQRAKEEAIRERADYLLTDGPPGTGCPAIAALTGTQLALLVMEPTQSSLHDAERIIDLIEQFNLPAAAVINKADLHKGITKKMEQFLKARSIPVLGKIPYDQTIVEAMVRARSVIEFAPESEAALVLEQTWEKIKGLLEAE
ncbi:MAG: P-loop NTPase [Bacteroidales bacterium]